MNPNTGAQEQYCECDTRSYKNQFNECTRCQDYLCPPQQGFAFQDRCFPPVCRANEVVRSDCSCEPCGPGSTADAQQRNCVASGNSFGGSCPEWTRLQPNGSCESDPCRQGEQLVRAGAGQGSCVACPVNEVSTWNYKGCYGAPTRVSCGANEIIIGGRCEPCGFNSQPDATQTYCTSVACPVYTRRQQNNLCEPDKCGPNEVNIQYDEWSNGQMQNQGMCKRCPQGQYASQPNPLYGGAQTTCEMALTSSGPDFLVDNSCRENEFLNTQGQCQRCSIDQYMDRFSGQCKQCGNYPRETQSMDGFSCQSQGCGFREFMNENSGQCELCAAYEQSDGYKCYEADCGDRFILTTEGQLEECPAYSKMVLDADGKKCRQCGADTCTGNDQLTYQGTCAPCQEYTIPDESKQQCVRPQCPDNAVILKDGTCQECGRGTNPDETQLNCVGIQCGVREKIIDNGDEITCEPCPKGTRAREQNSVCVADDCPTDEGQKQFINEQGLCIPCGPFQTLSEDGTQCVDSTCGDNEIILENGGCEKCPDYERRHDYGEIYGASRYICLPCWCDSTAFGRQVCKLTGECEVCPDYHLPDTTGKQCIKPDCPSKINKDGSCGFCEDFTQWDQEKEECVPTVCDARSKVLRDGTCEKCPAYYFVTENKKDCSACACGAREMCQEDGSCKACEDYHIVATSGDNVGECVKAECTNGILQVDGVCQPCASCETLNEDKTACVKPTCNDRSVIDQFGKCVECEAYTAPRLWEGDQCNAYCEACAPVGRQYLLESGECDTCADYSLISDDRRECKAQECPGNQIVLVSGVCSPCPPYTLADALKRECVETKCQNTEILKDDGTCEACPEYTRPGPDMYGVPGRVCMQDTCNDSQFYDKQGVCQPCGPCSRTSIDDKRLECFSDTCSATQVLLGDGRCNNCPPYTRPASTDDSNGKCGQECRQVDCAQNEIVLEDGTCQACPPWSMPQQNARVCGPTICGAREKLLISGRCEECQDYTRGGGELQKQQYTQCLPDTCRQNQVLTKEGTCAFCDPYTRADTDGKKCVRPDCGDFTKKLLPDATFETCPPYSRATERCISCSPEPCTLTEKLLENGKCQSCGDYMRATPDGRDCRMPVCEKNQILKKDGTCQDCPPFQRRATGGRECVEVTCSQTERLLPTGECEACEAYSRAIHKGRACAPNLCTQREKIMPDGTCEACPKYSRATSDHKGCAAQVCTARQILQVDGRCAECYKYTRADAEGKLCIPHNCNDRQKLGPDGSCVDCPDFERAQGTGLTCGPDTCNIRQRVQRDGTCIYCELFHAVCTNKKCCTKPTCKPMVEHITKDGLCAPCLFYQQTGPDGTTCVTDPTKKLPDPQIIAPSPVSLQSAAPPAPTYAGGDVWTDEQFLSEDRATGFYLNQQTGNLGFILGNAVRISSAVAAMGTAALIAMNAL